MVHAYPSFSPCLFFLSCSLQSLHSPFVLLYLSSSHFVPFCLRTAFLFLLLGTSLFSLSLILSALHPSFSVSFSLPLSSSSRRTCLLEGPELAGGHYGGYSVGFSVGLSKAHERVCPPRVKELPREQVHLLPYLSSPPSSFHFSSSSSLFLFLSFSLSSLHRVPLASRPMPPPVRTLGFYLFSLITAVGM